MSNVYLLSDLHLGQAPSQLRRIFRSFLEGPAREAQAVYILGDLFEYWIGDDRGLDDHADEVQALSALTAAGVPVFFQHGNRDFLVGKSFAARTGVGLLPDPYIADLPGQRTLLSHGDPFCTADLGYQRWRRFSRNAAAQAVYRMLPASLRERIAGGIRAQSDTHKQYKPEDIMDVSEAAIAQAFRESGALRMIHGHTHRPAEHRHSVDGRDCQRIVLADWRPERCEVLRVDERGTERIRLT